MIDKKKGSSIFVIAENLAKTIQITPEVKANYSLWKGTYQYADELTMPFMAANLIGGESKMRQILF